MTICIAAMCSEKLPDGTEMGLVIGASDRKYTAGSFTYEPYQTKWFYFSNDILGLISGDASDSVAICNDAIRRVGPIVGTTLVEDIAQAHALAFTEYRRNQAERCLLAPLGLSLTSYSQERRERVDKLDDELRRWELEDSAIITGVDHAGAHIWRVDDPGVATCHDSVGFAAIGSGATHAAAVFMRAKYERGCPSGRAALLTYQAKKAAEVDPYVGHETDMFVLTYGSQIPPGINAELRQTIESIHEGLIKEELTLRAAADGKVEDYVEQSIREPQRKAFQQEAATQAAAQLTTGQALDEEGLHDGTQKGDPQT